MQTFNFKHLTRLSLFSALLLFAGCGSDAQKSASIDDKADRCTCDQPHKKVNIRIAETTDMHGAIFPYDFINDTNVTYKGEVIPSLAQVSTFAKVQRKLDCKDNNMLFLMFDNGDLLQGQPIVNLYNNKDMSKINHIYADVMNYVRYDVGTIGNHDVEPGHKIYDNLVNQFCFPWLAANIVTEDDNSTTYFQPYTMIEREGVNIAVLGLTTPGVPMWLPQELWSGMRYMDMVESAKFWVDKIRSEENPDLLIGLFHAGWDFTYGGFSKDAQSNPNAVQLIMESVPEFDLVFFGHDHQPAVQELNGVKAIGGSSYCNMIGVADINMTWNSCDNRLEKEMSLYHVNTNDYEVDKAFMAEFEDAFEETKTFVSQTVGDFTEAVNSRDAAFKDAPFNDLIHQLEFYVAKEILNQEIDMTIAAPLQYDVTIDAGEVKYADMWKLYKYDNTYYIMRMSGAEIQKYLEYNYDLWMNQMQNENDHLINFKKTADGTIEKNANGCAQTVTRYYNYDSIAGITYTVDVSKAKGERVMITGIDKDLDGEPDSGETFNTTTEYKVGINSYRAGGGGGHMLEATGLAKEALPDSRVIVKTETGLRDYLLNWIKDQGSVTPVAFNNWKVIPEDWAIKGEVKSRADLYSNACTGH